MGKLVPNFFLINKNELLRDMSTRSVGPKMTQTVKLIYSHDTPLSCTSSASKTNPLQEIATRAIKNPCHDLSTPTQPNTPLQNTSKDRKNFNRLSS